jgi:predicted acyl esterase
MVAHAVTIVADDGERLAATLHLPAAGESATGSLAALLEALPYRKDDVTASYASTYARYVEAGFAVMRLDLRGTGSSTGSMTDEYPDVERADLRAAITWLATQPWSNGRVGMFGTSYSGFNSLHMAAEGVPELGAIVATYATDDRYTDDVHYAGGVLRALDLVDYPLYMVAMNALPPVPAVFGDGWETEWRRRIDATPPWLLEWMNAPTDRPTWRRGSIRLGPDGDGYGRISCPTMLVAGWADGYRNNTFRTVEQLGRHDVPWRMLAGPWVHKSPESARPGPNVDDDVEIIAFFDQHLRGGPPHTGSPGQVYVRAPIAPEPDLRFHPGRWIDLDTWPPAGLHVVTRRPDRGDVRRLEVSGDVGVAAWNSCGGGLPWGQPLDQRVDNARSIIYDWPIAAPADMIGNPSVTLRVRSDQTYGHVSVKLCDVFPDGTSALITRGMLDLTHVGCWPADSGGTVGRQPRPLDPGTWIDATVDLEATTWALAPGHTLRLAIAGTDWPNCWPPPGPVTLDIDGAHLQLHLPILDDGRESSHGFVVTPGLSDEAAAAESDGVKWLVEHDVLGRQTRVVTRYGGTYEGAHAATITDDYRGELGVSTIDPADAWARGSATFEVRWPSATVRTESTLSVRSSAAHFVVDVDLVVHHDDTEFARRSWTSTIPR